MLRFGELELLGELGAILGTTVLEEEIWKRKQHIYFNQKVKCKTKRSTFTNLSVM